MTGKANRYRILMYSHLVLVLKTVHPKIKETSIILSVKICIFCTSTSLLLQTCKFMLFNTGSSFFSYFFPEIEKIQKDEGKEEEKFIDVVINKNMKLGQKVLIPVKQFPKVSAMVSPPEISPRM